MQSPIFCTVAVVSEHMPHKLPKGTSDDSPLAGHSKQSENKDFAGMAAEMTEGTSDDTHLADDSKSNVGRVGSDGPPAAREGGAPPTSSMTQQIELVMMNGELLTTFKREEFISSYGGRRSGFTQRGTRYMLLGRRKT